MGRRGDPSVRAAVALLADPWPTPARRAAIARLARTAELDWEAVLALAADVTVGATVAAHVLALGPARVPATALALARSLRDTAIFRELTERREVRGVLDALARAALPPPILLKGVALRECHYPAPWQRAVDDLDLLVPPRSLARVEAALAGIGYVAREAPAGRLVSAAHWPARTLVGAGRALRIDVHTALVRPVRFTPDEALLLARARPLAIDGRPAFVLDDGDALLFLAMHEAEHAGRGALKRLVDVALLLRRGRFRWVDVYRHARRAHAVAALRASLALAARVFGAPLPPWVHGVLHDRGLRARLLRRAILPPRDAVFVTRPRHRLGELALLYAIPDGALWRLRFALNYIGLRARDAWVARRAPRTEDDG